MMTLADINALSEEAFVAAFGNLYEHSPWVARGAAQARPFVTIGDMQKALSDTVRSVGVAAQHALVCAHPDLGQRAGSDPVLTEASQAEQKSAGLDRLSSAEYERFSTLNAAYHAKFSMPFVICVRRADKDIILAAMEQRLASTQEAELETALTQIDRIAGLRLADRIAS